MKSIKILLFLIMMNFFVACMPLEGCDKTYSLTGKITDSSNVPLSNVKVRWYYADANQPEIVLGYTDSSGNYLIKYPTKATLIGDSLEFVKDGYKNIVAMAYTADEAGRSKCGDIQIKRDAQFQP